MNESSYTQFRVTQILIPYYFFISQEMQHIVTLGATNIALTATKPWIIREKDLVDI